MPQVCINRPNRTERRYFKSCDAARIAREVVRDDPETTPEEVLACIAKGFGFTHISLSRVRVVESAVIFTKIPIKPTLTILAKLLEKLAETSRLLKRLLGPALVVLKKAIDLADKIDIIEPPQAEVDDVINPGKCRCKDRFIQPKNEVMINGN